jgi:ABC-type multidrug transport system ATPase subunit
MATVRESLEFSALLRQPATTPREEKLAYVDVIIDSIQLQHYRSWYQPDHGARASQ